MGKQGVKTVTFCHLENIEFLTAQKNLCESTFYHPILPQVCPFYLADPISVLDCEFLKVIKMAVIEVVNRR